MNIVGSLTRLGQCPMVHSTVPVSVPSGQSWKQGGGWYPPTAVLLNVYWILRTVPVVFKGICDFCLKV